MALASCSAVARVFLARPGKVVARLSNLSSLLKIAFARP